MTSANLLLAERPRREQAAQMSAPQPEGLQRVAHWADVYLVPILVALVMLVDIAAGINWAFAGTVRLGGPAYHVARTTGPIWHLGAMMLVMCAIKVVAMFLWGRGWLLAYFSCAPLAGAWAFWAIVFGLAPNGVTGVSYLNCILSIFMMSMHFLLGLLLSRPVKV